VSEQQAGRDQRAFGLLRNIDGWEHVDGGAFGDSYWLVPASANEDERYHVTTNQCTCLDFAYRGRSLGACKHIRALKAMLRVLRARATDE